MKIGRTSQLFLSQTLIVSVLFVASAITASAQTNILSARNTSLQIDVGGLNPGLSEWQVNNVDQLDQQWFYYSIGSGPVNSIDTISPWTTPTINGAGGSSPILTENYADSALSLQTSYTLGSGPTGSSHATLTTLLSVQNTSGTNLTLHLYQYSDFWLGGVSTGQNVQFIPGSLDYEVDQTGLNGGPLVGYFNKIPAGATVEEMAGLYDGTQFGLGNGNTAPALNNVLSAGTGNVVFAYEIDVNLASGSGLQISEIQAVPEPSSLALILSGIFALGLSYYRRMDILKIIGRNA